ncbi:hypothetical protein AVEN_35092-1 [Araneus ventricosus]|uniref:Uncharacterized protein n=1 Tax=Araneus ventricosus TaxID=182803 RepID=A0A4Y2I5W2_ARAVE|nr:hypothetical protein AVEN_35092-1 [Araneus ventricosus]
MIMYLPQEFQSTVQQIYRWKDREFTAGKIEAELALEANRLQLMKQDLEKTETVFHSSASASGKSSEVPSGANAITGDASDYSDDEDDLDTVIDSLSGRLMLETSSESPSTLSEKPSASTASSLTPCSEIKWIRKIGREVTGVDIYYWYRSGENIKSEKLPDSAEGQQEANVVEVRIPAC